MEEQTKINQKQNTKISYPEIVLITPILLFVDLLEVIGTMLLGSIIFSVGGLFLNFLGVFVAVIVQIYLFIKGIKNLVFLIGTVVDTIPLVSWLPTKTITWIITVIVVNKGISKKLPNIPNVKV